MAGAPRSAPRSAPVPPPDGGMVEPAPITLDGCPPVDQPWVVRGDHGRLWFQPVAPGNAERVLIVSFDNLATIDEGFPRMPWMWRRLSTLGHAVLGVQSHAKDWFRHPTAPHHLRRLQELGFFAGFSQVVLIGASMGGFAALNYAPLIPGAQVIAFSAQTSMNKVVAPFEARFPWAVRNSNWDGMPFLDAAAAIPYIRRVVLIYDPFTPEDARHARRMIAPHVQHVHCPHGTHEAVRVVLLAGALPALIGDVLRFGRAGPGYFRAMRNRRGVAKWQRALLNTLARRGRHAAVIRAATLLEQAVPEGGDPTFLRRLRRASQKALAGGGGAANKAGESA